MQCAWRPADQWLERPICALALDQGCAFLFDLQDKKVLAGFMNQQNRVSTILGGSGQIRHVAFSPTLPLLVLGESEGHVHVIDLLTMRRQIISYTPQRKSKRITQGKVRHLWLLPGYHVALSTLPSPSIAPFPSSFLEASRRKESSY